MKKLLLCALAISASAVAWADLPAKAFPQEGTYYQLRNADYNKIYIGYYPTTGDTEWFISTPSHPNRENDMTVKDKLDRLASANVATGGAALDGQLWTFIPGTGENAGMYAMVCKAYPEGAVRKTMITVDGSVTTNGNNDSRYGYIANRTTNADDVAWFTISLDGTSYMLKANDGSNNYLTLAGPPKNYELMRYDSSGSCNWTPIEYKPDYQCDGAVTYTTASGSQVNPTPGKHKVLFNVATQAVDGFMFPEAAASATAYANVYFGGKDATKNSNSVFPAEYVYTINVDENGQFTIRNYYGYYAVILSSANTSSAFVMCTETNEANAEKFTLQKYITGTYSERYMLQATSQSTWQVHLGNNNHFCYLATQSQGKAAAGESGRTAAAFLMYEAKEAQLTADDIAKIYTDGVATLKTAAEGYAAMSAEIGGAFPNSSFVEGTTDVDVANAAISTDNAAYQAYINKFQHKFVTVQAVARNNAYLGIYPSADGNSVLTNTKAEKFDGAVWYIDIQSNNTVTLRNLSTGYLMANLIPTAINGGFGFSYANGNFFNVAAGNGDATIGAQSDASYVTVAPASFAFAQPQVGKYYRILSDRWMSANAAPCLAVRGETRDATGPGEQVFNANISNYGIYWRLEQGATEGTYKIVNLIDGYSFGPASESSKTLTQHNGDGADVYIVCTKDAPLNQSGKTFSIANSYGIGSQSILNTNDSYTNANFMDANSGGYVIYNEWNPVRQGVGNIENNGSLWYFVEADNAEIEAAKTRYVAAVQTKVADTPNDSPNLTQLAYGDKEIMADYDAYFKNPGELTSVEAVNRAKRSIYATVDQIISRHLIGQHIQLMATKPEADNFGEHYLIDEETTNATGSTTTKIGTTTDPKDPTTLWTVEAGPTAGAYIFTNEITGRKIGYGNDSENSDIPTVSTGGQQYHLAYNAHFKGFAMHRPVNSATDKRCLHVTNDYNVVKWWAVNNDNKEAVSNSYWVIKALDDAPAVIELNREGVHELHFNDGKILDNAAAKSHSVIVDRVNPEAGIAAQSLEFPMTISHDQFDEDGLYSFGEQLPAGVYTVTVPGAMATNADGFLTRAAAPVFTVAANGGVTGIHEVTSDNDCRPVDNNYYDLQGRRVANPTHGIYIHQGRKVLVK